MSFRRSTKSSRATGRSEAGSSARRRLCGALGCQRGISLDRSDAEPLYSGAIIDIRLLRMNLPGVPRMTCRSCTNLLASSRFEAAIPRPDRGPGTRLSSASTRAEKKVARAGVGKAEVRFFGLRWGAPVPPNRKICRPPLCN